MTVANTPRLPFADLDDYWIEERCECGEEATWRCSFLAPGRGRGRLRVRYLCAGHKEPFKAHVAARHISTRKVRL